MAILLNKGVSFDYRELFINMTTTYVNKSGFFQPITNASEFDFSFCKICNRAIKGKGNRLSFFVHLQRTHKINTQDYYKMFWEVPKCKCGCNEDVNYDAVRSWWAEYRKGHFMRVHNHNAIPEGEPFVILSGMKHRVSNAECDVCKKIFQEALSTVNQGKKQNRKMTCSPECYRILAKKLNSGSNNPCWKGGVATASVITRRSVEYSEWRTSVYERDNYTCQMCFKRGGHLQGHHILKFADYSDYKFELWNGITLCHACHQPTKYHEEDYVELFLHMTCGEVQH